MQPKLAVYRLQFCGLDKPRMRNLDGKQRSLKLGPPEGEKMVEARMDVSNVADAVVFMATRTPEANVLFMTVMATKMPLVGRG